MPSLDACDRAEESRHQVPPPLNVAGLQLLSGVAWCEKSVVEWGKHVTEIKDVLALQLSTQPAERTVRGEVSVACDQIVQCDLIEEAMSNKKGKIAYHLKN